MSTEGLTSTVTGEVERGDEVSLLRKIHVCYRLPVVAEADRAKVDRVMGFHARHCGVYRSLHPQIEITTELQWVDG